MKHKRNKQSAATATFQQHGAAAAAAKEACSQQNIATDSYAYDPERAANRRVLAYTNEEFEQLSKEKQQKVLRNRQTAQMSKARKRARLQDLQDNEAELQQHQQELQQQLAVLRDQVQAAAAATHALLQGCSCQACRGLQEQLLTSQAAC
jgi:acyl carrier protein phosphodiesterase